MWLELLLKLVHYFFQKPPGYETVSAREMTAEGHCFASNYNYNKIIIVSLTRVCVGKLRHSRELMGVARKRNAHASSALPGPSRKNG